MKVALFASSKRPFGPCGLPAADSMVGGTFIIVLVEVVFLEERRVLEGDVEIIITAEKLQKAFGRTKILFYVVQKSK